jgi:hypothetical protein
MVDGTLTVTASYPMTTVGLLQAMTEEGVIKNLGTGVMVGPNFLVTNSQLVPWDDIPTTAILFIPGYDPNSAALDPPEPFGTAWITQVYGYGSASTTSPYDVYVCHVGTDLGTTTTGWCGIPSLPTTASYNNIVCLVLGFGTPTTPFQGGDLGFDYNRSVSATTAADGFFTLDIPIEPSDFPTGAVAWTIESDGFPYVVGVYSHPVNEIAGGFTGGPSFLAMVKWAWSNWAS